MALLPSIAAGIPIDEMQSGQNTWLRTVFYDNGSLATGGRAYFDNLAPDDQIRFLDALRARRQVFQQQAAMQATETTPSLAQLYQNAFAEIEPVLDRYATNEKFKDLANDAPAIRIYLSLTGLSPRNGAAWLQSLSGAQQTRVLEAIADRNAVRNIGSRLLAASKILADPANDVSSAAAGIERSAEDLLRLCNDSGLTERGRQYLPSLSFERQSTIEYNFSLRSRRRPAIPSPAFSLSVPPTPASDSNLDLDAWRAQLIGTPAHGSPMPATSQESVFSFPPTPAGGWQANLDTGEGTSHWHHGATSAAPAHSSVSSFSLPPTPAGGWQANLDAGEGTSHWHHGATSPPPAHSPISSFSLPPTPPGGWQANLDTGEGTSHWHHDATSPPPAHSPVSSFSLPPTPPGGWQANLDTGEGASHWHHGATSAAPAHSPVSSFSLPPTPPGGWQANLDTGEGTSHWHHGATSAAPAHSSVSSFSLPPTPAGGWQANLDAGEGTSHWHHGATSTPPARSPESLFSLPPTPSGGWLPDLNAREGSPHWHDEAASAPPAYSREFSLSLPATPAAGSHLDLNLDAWHEQLVGEPIRPMQPPRSPSPVHRPPVAPSTDVHAGDASGSRNPRLPPSYGSVAAAAKARQARERHQKAFAEIAPVLGRYAVDEKITEVAQEAPSIITFMTKAGLKAPQGEAWYANLNEDQQTLVREAINDRNAMQNIGRYMVQISELFADPANDLSAVATRTGLDLQDLRRVFTESGMTERGAQYLSRLRSERQIRVTQNIQLRNLPFRSITVPDVGATLPRPWLLDTAAGEGSSRGQGTSSRAPRAPDEQQLASIVDAIGTVPIGDLQHRVAVPLADYFVPGDGITEKGFRFLRTLSEQQQTHLQFALSIPRDVMTFYEINALLDRYEAGVANGELRPEMPNLSSYLTEGGGLGRMGGTVWFRHLPPDRQARITRAIENRQIITAIGPRFTKIASTFSNPANDMDRVARRAGVSVEQLARFLTEDGLTPLGQRFLDTCDNRTRQVIEANIAMRRR